MHLSERVGAFFRFGIWNFGFFCYFILYMKVRRGVWVVCFQFIPIYSNLFQSFPIICKFEKKVVSLHCFSNERET